MEIVSRRKLLKDNLIVGLKRFLTLNLTFLLLLALVRVFEFTYLKYTITLAANSMDLELKGFAHDLLMLLNYSAILFGPYLLLHLISRSLANLVYGLLILLFVILEVAMIQYLGSTSLILGADLFGYSLKEVIDIASAGGGFSVKTGVILLVCIAFFVGLIRFTSHFKPGILLTSFFLAISFCSLFFANKTQPLASDYPSEMAYNLVSNKSFHILSAAHTLFYPAEYSETSLFSYFYTGLASNGISFKYVSKEYPFLRKDETPDVLGKYFNLHKEKPNLVFLVVESLGRAYSGEGAYLHSFTSFLDSLENRSLYWENVVSTAGRTFEALPSIFGSLPYGRSGFAEMGSEMPEGMSLINLLKQRGYESRFYYGGDASFDNMKIFLNYQHIDHIIEERDFGPGYVKMPVIAGNFTWGYPDKDIFRKGFEVLAKADSTPRLDIYLTLAMHDPYKIPDQEYYNQKVEEKLTQLNLEPVKKVEYRKYLENYATILYFNDALRYFFNEYKKRDDYKNTIFFITGDHRMSSPPISTQIDRFHVPLIVYSPMLKGSAKFSSVVSHLDFTPSVVAFLKKNYNMKFPSFVPWMGQGLDSAAAFRSTRTMPFIRTKNEIIDYLDQDYFMVNDQLFKVSKGLAIDKITDDKKLTDLQRSFEKFKTDNINACFNGKIIPDSLKYRVGK